MNDCGKQHQFCTDIFIIFIPFDYLIIMTFFFGNYLYLCKRIHSDSLCHTRQQKSVRSAEQREPERGGNGVISGAASGPSSFPFVNIKNDFFAQHPKQLFSNINWGMSLCSIKSSQWLLFTLKRKSIFLKVQPKGSWLFLCVHMEHMSYLADHSRRNLDLGRSSDHPVLGMCCLSLQGSSGGF